MSVTENTPMDHVDHDGMDHDHDHEHPTDRSYVMIALGLAVLTAVEVLLFVLEDWIGDNLGLGSVKIALVLLMIVKFWIVGAYFMHLKFDHQTWSRKREPWHPAGRHCWHHSM